MVDITKKLFWHNYVTIGIILVKIMRIYVASGVNYANIGHWCQSYTLIKLKAKKARSFVPSKTIQPSILFMSKDRSNLNGGAVANIIKLFKV